uniref:Uncharacterized protein n=1 Tax=uncultured marine group II/III euryarchaeote SAT1000_09_G02 TaxID=1456557 RepID=A0A075I406_9EURY|nr:hypothetical protein [uncultured marine group II/III euryarchaeote SAT1000_09_G02]
MNDINFHDSGDGEKQTLFNFDLSWRHLRSEMMGHSKIKVRGERRGRLYRHISTRPRLPDRLVAKLLTWRMNKLDSGFAEKNRDEMYVLLAGELKSLHHYIETGVVSPVPHLEFSEEKLMGMKDGYKKLALELKLESLQDEYRGTYDGDFEKWAMKTYTREWFLQSWSNITLEMKSLGARPGSKRGTWTMHPKPKVQQTLRQSTQTILKLIEKIEANITRISKESQDEESVLDMGITGLSSSIKFLEKKRKI